MEGNVPFGDGDGWVEEALMDGYEAVGPGVGEGEDRGGGEVHVGGCRGGGEGEFEFAEG